MRPKKLTQVMTTNIAIAFIISISADGNWKNCGVHVNYIEKLPDFDKITNFSTCTYTYTDLSFTRNYL